MPPPSRPIFLCTPVNQTACTFACSLLSTCTSHLSRTHPELAELKARDGLTALEALVRRGTLHAVPTPLATRLFVCNLQTCRYYCLTLADAVAHYEDAPHDENTTVVRREYGNSGVARMVKQCMRVYVVMENEDEEEEEDEDEEEEEEEEEEEQEEEAQQEEEVFEPGIINIGGTGMPMLAETVAQLADMIRRHSGPVAGGWARAMRAGKVKVHFDHRDGASGVCTVRNDAKVAELKLALMFGVVKVDDDQEG